MDKATATWFQHYYGLGLGASAPVLNKASEEIEQEYEQYFLKPIIYMVTGKEDPVTDKSVLNNCIMQLRYSKFQDWMYMLSWWVKSKTFEYTGDLDTDLYNCFNKTDETCDIIYATAGINCKDIQLHTVAKAFVDTLPVDVFIYPRWLKVHSNGRMLKDLASKSPLNITDAEASVLRNAVARGIITTNDLTTSEVTLPAGSADTEKIATITSVSQDKPPMSYFSIAANLGSSFTAQYKTLFQAVSAYCAGKDIDDALKDYLFKVAGNFVVENPSINDDVVKAYLLEKYNIKCDDLRELSSNKAKLPIYEISQDVLEGSTEELYEAVSNASETSLDLLISNLCTQEKISLQCTIKQLLDAINYDIHPAPPSFVDSLIDYMTANQIDGDTTLNEVVQGIKHKDIDPTDYVIEWIMSSDSMDDDMKSILMRNISDLEEISTKSIIIDYLPKLELSKDMTSRFVIAITNDLPVELPVSVDGDDAYKAGELLLRKTREAIAKDASFQVRSAYTPILYSFLRLLMMDLGSERTSAADLLRNNANGTTPEVAELLDTAIHIING